MIHSLIELLNRSYATDGMCWAERSAVSLQLAIGIEDALDCMAQGMTRAEFVGCAKPERSADNLEWWDKAEALAREAGTLRKAQNAIGRYIQSFA